MAPRKPGGATRATRRGNGPGWGGAAKGAASARGETAAPFEAGNQTGAVPNDQRDFTAAERRARMLGIYVEVAEDKSQPGMARISAADKWLDRIEGKPLARSAEVPDAFTGLTNEQLHILLAAAERDAASGFGDAGAAGVDPTPVGKPH